MGDPLAIEAISTRELELDQVLGRARYPAHDPGLGPGEAGGRDLGVGLALDHVGDREDGRLPRDHSAAAPGSGDDGHGAVVRGEGRRLEVERPRRVERVVHAVEGRAAGHGREEKGEEEGAHGRLLVTRSW